MSEKYSESAKNVLSGTISASKEMGHSYIGSEHLLLGILSDESTFSCAELNKRGVYYKIIKKRIISISGVSPSDVPFNHDVRRIDDDLVKEKMTPKCKSIISKAENYASTQDACVTADLFLYALLMEECVGLKLLISAGIEIADLRSCIEKHLEKNNLKAKTVSTPLLDKISVDLTEKASKGLIEAVIGREEAEEKIIRILLRKSKNNPCLIGEAGVGKTAIVEGLALRIAKGNVPFELMNTRIVSLDISSVVSGTKYRGEFEEKLKSVIDEVKRAKNVILFIDEIHCVVGAGAAEGAIDASNILKPPLARGEIRLIGATTLKEYKKYIEKDGAFDRRFRKINVKEPTESECVNIIKGIKDGFEKHHGVNILDEAITASVSLSTRYVTDRFLPDKAIDLIDEASSLAKTRGNDKVSRSDVEAVLEEATGIPTSVMSRDECEGVLLLKRK